MVLMEALSVREALGELRVPAKIHAYYVDALLRDGTWPRKVFREKAQLLLEAVS